MDPIILLLLLQASSGITDDPCFAKATTQLELNRCAGASLEVADSRLADFVRLYEARLTVDQRELFQAAQISWQQFRQASCEFETNRVHGGSAYPVVFSQCMASKARARLSELETLASCLTGDLGCPTHAGVAPMQPSKPRRSSDDSRLSGASFALVEAPSSRETR